MSAEENKAIVVRFIEEVINGKNVATVDQYVADDFVDHAALPGTVGGLPGFKQFLAMACKALPDVSWTTEHLIAEGDVVVCRYRCRGTPPGRVPLGRRSHLGSGPHRETRRRERDTHRPRGRRQDRGALGERGLLRHDAADGGPAAPGVTHGQPPSLLSARSSSGHAYNGLRPRRIGIFL